MNPPYTSERVDYFQVPRPMWRKIKKVLPKHKKTKLGGRPRIPDRAVINGIWYILWTGCQWKAVHRDWFGASSSVLHERFQTWRALGVFQQIMRRLMKYYAKKRNVKWKWQAIDSKACPAPLGGEDTGRNPTDRGKQGSKIHLLVDKRGVPLAVFITGANRHDTAGFTMIESAECTVFLKQVSLGPTYASLCSARRDPGGLVRVYAIRCKRKVEL